MYPDTELHIAGRWRAGADRETLGVLNPATGETIGQCAEAARAAGEDQRCTITVKAPAQ